LPLSGSLTLDTVVLYNVIHVSGLRANLVSLGALHKEEASVWSIKMGLVIDLGSEKLFHAILAREKWYSVLYSGQRQDWSISLCGY